MKQLLPALVIVIFLCSCGGQDKPPTTSNTTQAPENVGKQLFSTNCASCHIPNKDLVGPALTGVRERWNDKAKLYRFIRNSQEVIGEDAYAKSLYIKYNKTMMLPFPNLTDEQITAILDYVDENNKVNK
jgi:mono/diheme cytochrome c family protein